MKDIADKDMMFRKSIIPSQCQACGRPLTEKSGTCVCGHNNEGWKHAEQEQSGVTTGKKGGKLTNNLASPEVIRSDEEIFVKEIDSWLLTFSAADNSFSLSTPALQSFKLKFTLEDLEEILESVYKITGTEKTIRLLQVSADDIPDLIGRISQLIDEKRSKLPLKFDSSELQGLADSINKKLQD